MNDFFVMKCSTVIYRKGPHLVNWVLNVEWKEEVHLWHLAKTGCLSILSLDDFCLCLETCWQVHLSHLHRFDSPMWDYRAVMNRNLQEVLKL